MRESILSFARYEKKYLLSAAQHAGLWAELAPRLRPDEYFASTVCSLYYDDPDFSLIRASIEAPVYKEKLRLRSYGQVAAGGEVFVELKKKYRQVVYKRRLALPERQAMSWLRGGPHLALSGQIAAEIDYFLAFYGELRPTVWLSYEREASIARDGSDLRLTFDNDIRCRRQELSLTAPVWGRPLLEADVLLLEVKCGGGLPLWLTRILAAEGLYKTSFSKYGTAYRTLILPEWKELNADARLVV